MNEAEKGGMATAVDVFAHDVEAILGEVEGLLTGPRQQAYGRPDISLSRIADMWSAILGQMIEPEQVALCLAAMKIAREANRHDRDNIVDAIGYLVLGQTTADRYRTRKDGE